MDNRMKSVDQKEFLGGQGTVHFDHILEADEMHGMNRVYAKVTLQKGCSVGYHAVSYTHLTLPTKA